MATPRPSQSTGHGVSSIQTPQQQQQPVLIGQSYTGPIPQPADLQHYDAIYPGAAKLIFQDFAERGKHVRFVEKWNVVGGFVMQLLGMLSALAVTLFLFNGAFQLLQAGKSIEGLSVLAGSAVTPAAAFIAGRRAAAKIARTTQGAGQKP